MPKTSPEPSKADDLRTVIRSMPKEAYQKRVGLAVAYLIRDFLLLAVTVGITLWADSWWVGIPMSFCVGTMLISLFVLGHDAGHRAFAKTERMNNFVGHITTSLCLWPFHVWRLSHDEHHRHTNDMSREIAWRPLTVKQFGRQSAWNRWLYQQTRTNLVWIASALFTSYFIQDGMKGRRSLHFKPDEQPGVRFSLWLTGLLALGMIVGSWMAAGIYGVVCLFVLPQIVFQGYLSIITYLHHTDPDRQFLAADEWTPFKGQLGSTFQVHYPAIIEWCFHDINWHVPHHVSVGIPFYNLRKAHAFLKEKFPGVVVEKRLSWKLLRETTAVCHLVTGKQAGELGWRHFSSLTDAPDAAQAQAQRAPT